MTHEKTVSLSLVNVGDKERIASITLGTALVVNALVTGKRLKLFKGLLGMALLYRGVSGYCPVNGAIARSSTKDGISNINIRTGAIINRSRQEVYDYWRKLDNIPFLMKHIDSVRPIDATLSEWKLKVPGNLVDITWTAEIVKDEPGYLIGWQSVADAPLETSGKVSFTDTPEGATEVDVIISYHPPKDRAGNIAAHLLAPAFRRLVQSDIRNFKYLLEGLNNLDTEPV